MISLDDFAERFFPAKLLAETHQLAHQLFTDW